MIYLVYFTKESGELVWSFRHPLSPTELIAKVAGKDDVLISGFISAISGFGSETLGDKLQSIDFERVRLYFRYLHNKEKNILVTVVSDKEDAPEAIWDTITEFIKRNKQDLTELTDEFSLLDSNRYNTIYARLNKSMLKLLDSKKRNIELLAPRNMRTVIIGLIPSLIVFFAMVGVTLWLASTYKLVPGPGNPGNAGVLIAIIVFLTFIIPSVVMGFTIGYREGTRWGGFGLGAISMVLLSIIFWKNLLGWAHGLGLEYYLPFLLAIVIFIVGSGMYMIGAWVAWTFIERKTLVPPSEKELIGQIGKVELEESEAEHILDEFSKGTEKKSEDKQKKTEEKEKEDFDKKVLDEIFEEDTKESKK